jgi:hypothetical protein
MSNARAPARTQAHASSLGLAMALKLRDDLHWCNCEGRAVFLDIRADRYFCLPQASNDAFLRLAAGRVQGRDQELLRGLVAKGVLTEGSTGVRVQLPPVIGAPTCDLVDERFQSAPFLWTLRALAAEFRAAWTLRTRRFHHVVEAARERGRCGSGDLGNGPHVAKEIASAAAAAAFVTRSHDRCLVRALAVHALCSRSGLTPGLVFGVSAHPFAAHCWVQLGNAVLVGGFEQARLYTPILVV